MLSEKAAICYSTNENESYLQLSRSYVFPQHSVCLILKRERDSCILLGWPPVVDDDEICLGIYDQDYYNNDNHSKPKQYSDANMLRNRNNKKKRENVVGVSESSVQVCGHKRFSLPI